MNKQEVIDYVLNTPNNTNPRILGQMLEEYATGGEETWNTVFEGSVTTEASDFGAFGEIQYESLIDADKIKVTFNGTEYECPKMSAPTGANAYGGIGESGPDFSEYPFAILSAENQGTVSTTIYTQTAGTYTLKIEEPQSGGSSDFSTAEVTINKGKLGAQVNCIMPWLSEEYNATSAFFALDELTESWTVKVPVGGSFITVYFSRAPQSISGDIEAGSDTTIMSQNLKSYTITGDCSISFS